MFYCQAQRKAELVEAVLVDLEAGLSRRLIILKKDKYASHL
jgi:hypothetical protein